MDEATFRSEATKAFKNAIKDFLIKADDWVEFTTGAQELAYGQTIAQVIRIEEGSRPENSRVYFINKYGRQDWVRMEWCVKIEEKSALIKKLFSIIDDEQSKS